MDMSFAQAINEDKVLKLKVLNEGFSDPQLISLSYYQASLVVDHIVDTYGEPKLRDLIRSYGEGSRRDGGQGGARCQPRSAADRFRRAAREAVRAHCASRSRRRRSTASRRSTILRRWPRAIRRASRCRCSSRIALHQAKDPKGAIQALERAAKLAPTATGDNNPNKMIAAIAARDEGRAQADPGAR